MSFCKHVGIAAGCTSHATSGDLLAAFPAGNPPPPSQFIGRQEAFSLPQEIYGQTIVYAEVALFVKPRPGAEGYVALGTNAVPFTQVNAESDLRAYFSLTHVRGRAVDSVTNTETIHNDVVIVKGVIIKPGDKIFLEATQGAVELGVMITKVV